MWLSAYSADIILLGFFLEEPSKPASSLHSVQQLNELNRILETISNISGKMEHGECSAVDTPAVRSEYILALRS